jgi:phosphonoacetaldehyde hydrolase
MTVQLPARSAKVPATPSAAEKSPAQARRRYPGPLRAVIFDWAGTIVDYGSRAPVLAVMKVFEDCGVPVTTAEARGPMGMAKLDHIKAIFAMPRVHDAWKARHGHDPNDQTVNEVYTRFLASQLDVLVDSSAPIPGAVDALNYCRSRNLKLGSSTGYTAALMKPLLAAANSSGLQVDSVVCADDVPHGRPAPWLCLENARRLNVYPMVAVVAVDDTAVGIQAGVNAGMWTIGIAKSGNGVGLSEAELAALPPAEQAALVVASARILIEAGAHLVIDSVTDLPAALQQIEAWLAAGVGP